MFKRIALWPTVVIIVLLVLFAPSIWATEFPVISTTDLKNKIDAKEEFLLVNALSGIEFGLEHISGSINIPAGEIQTTDKLPANKKNAAFFY
jgi:hypothetical protein